jgi:hypothetical protein
LVKTDNANNADNEIITQANPIALLPLIAITPHQRSFLIFNLEEDRETIHILFEF